MAKIAPDIWLALGIAAEQYGGVGYGGLRMNGIPCCIFGLAADLDGLTEEEAESLVYKTWVYQVKVSKPAAVTKALQAAGIKWRDNDNAHREARAGNFQERVPFEAWAEAIELEPDTES